MKSSGDLWTIVLAAGEGSRLRELTLDPSGDPVPKQFWRIDQNRTMLQWAMDRARRQSRSDRVVPVVAAKHRRFWKEEFRSLPAANLVIQPENRGTAAGILLPLLRVLTLDPHATVVVLPSDHYVANEDVLERSLRRARLVVEAEPQKVVLLGMTPSHADTELGWIQPTSTGGWARPVEAFVEKPAAELAQELWRKGALWNSFMFVAKAMTLVSLYEESQRALLAAFINRIEAGGWSVSNLERLYEEIPSIDFSRGVLQPSPAALAVLSVPACGWSDLGTPPRVAAWRQAAPIVGPSAPRRFVRRPTPVASPALSPAFA